MTKHKHAAVIKAWADGAAIQMKCGDEWQDFTVECPLWRKEFDYRIKPVEPEKIYPCTQMTGDQLHSAYFVGRPGVDLIWSERGLRQVSDAALKHACDNRQVVRREDFDRLQEKLNLRTIELSIARSQIKTLERF